MRSFPGVKPYLRAWADDPRNLGVISQAMAARALEVTRGGVDRMIERGDLATVTIGETVAVLACAVNARVEERREKVRTVEAFVEGVAASGRSTTYEPVMATIGLRPDMPPHRKEIAIVLEKISRRSFKKRGLLLSALVHRKTAGMTKPSPAFFELAKEFDFPPQGVAPEHWLADHMLRIFRAYS